MEIQAGLGTVNNRNTVEEEVVIKRDESLSKTNPSHQQHRHEIND